MKSEPYICSSCPYFEDDLTLIETHFEHGKCFIDTECRHCGGHWTAEVTISDNRGIDGLFGDRVTDLPKWRIVKIWPTDRL